MNIHIIGTGTYLPRDSFDKPGYVNTFKGVGNNIDIFSGIGKRHICNQNETPTFMGIQAAKNALKNSNIDPKSIEVVVCYTAVPDHETPKDVYRIAHEIGCDGAMCWTIDTACASFLSHLNCAYSLTLAGKKRILIINSMNWVNRAFNKDDGQFAGDGAGAIIIERCNNSQHYIASNEISSTEQFDFIKMNSAQLTGKREEIHFSKNKNTILRSVDILPEVANRLLEEQSIARKDINWVICHQPGFPAIERWHSLLEIPMEKNLNTFSLYGNMSAANIPITLDYFLEQNRIIKNDDLVLFFSAGAGIHVIATLYRL